MGYRVYSFLSTIASDLYVVNLWWEMRLIINRFFLMLLDEPSFILPFLSLIHI